MKAVVLTAFGGPEHFDERDLPEPSPAAGEIRVRTRAIGFNPVDCQIRSGRLNPPRVKSMVLGRDFSGVVDAVHESVRDFAVGDEVFGNVCNLASSGTYAESIVLPAELAARKPPGLTHEHAAAIPVAGITATLLLEKLGLAPGKSLLVTGASGGVGSFCVLLGNSHEGERVHAMAGSAQRRDYLVNSCGVSRMAIVDYRDRHWALKALEANKGAFDAIIDLVGGEVLSASCGLLALNGHLASAVDPASADDFEKLFDRNASFHSVGAHSYSLSPARTDWLRYRSILNGLADRFDSGLPQGMVQVVGRFGKQAVERAHHLLDGRQVHGKLVMSA